MQIPSVRRYFRRRLRSALAVLPLLVGIAVVGLTANLCRADQAHPSPANQCWQGSCSTEQARIYDAFNRAGPLDMPQRSVVYTGLCYHRSASTDSNQAQFALQYLHERDGKTYVDGSYGFFYAQNPWITWTPADAEAALKPTYHENSVLHSENDGAYAWVDFNPGQVPIVQYYYRASGGHVYSVGFWGVTWTLFCDFTANGSGN